MQRQSGKSERHSSALAILLGLSMALGYFCGRVAAEAAERAWGYWAALLVGAAVAVGVAAAIQQIARHLYRPGRT